MKGLLLILFFVVIVYGYSREQRSILHNTRTEIFKHLGRMGQEYEYCSVYMGYKYEPNSGDEDRKCKMAVFQCQDLEKLQTFLNYLQVFNPEL